MHSLQCKTRKTEISKSTTSITSTAPSPPQHPLLSPIFFTRPPTHRSLSSSCLKTNSSLLLLQTRIITARPALCTCQFHFKYHFIRHKTYYTIIRPRNPPLPTLLRLIKARTITSLRPQRLGLNFRLISNLRVSARERSRVAAGPAGLSHSSARCTYRTIRREER